MERLKAVAADLGLPWGVRTRTYNNRRAQELGKWADSLEKGDAFHLIGSDGSGPIRSEAQRVPRCSSVLYSRDGFRMSGKKAVSTPSSGKNAHIR
jgi:hypothetical protein